jgi:hypothetical protein
MKNDAGKLRYDLIDWRSIEEIAKVMTEGAKTHGDEGWRDLLNGKNRYFAALMRHLLEWRIGEGIDKDSGMPHLAHVMCNAMFLSSLDRIKPEVEVMDKMMSTEPPPFPPPPPPPRRPLKLPTFPCIDGNASVRGPDFHFAEGHGHD